MRNYSQQCCFIYLKFREDVYAAYVYVIKYTTRRMT